MTWPKENLYAIEDKSMHGEIEEMDLVLPIIVSKMFVYAHLTVEVRDKTWASISKSPLYHFMIVSPITFYLSVQFHLHKPQLRDIFSCIKKNREI